MTAIPPITLPAAPTLFQSTFNFSSPGELAGGQAGFAPMLTVTDADHGP
jgi:hypothetical protein